jgi:uncharacterized RDD family membrane protein YckC
MTDSAENQPDQAADHLAAAARSDTLGGPLADPAPHPWARYWAKMVDMGVFLGLAMIVMLLARWNGAGLDLWAWALWVVLFPAIEALLIAGFAGTPGKAVFRVTVTDADGGRLSLKAALLRAYAAMLMGSALCAPVLSFAANILGYLDYSRRGLTRWDRLAAARTLARPNGQSWIVLCVILLVAFIFAFLFFTALLMQA